ncbi:serine/threonine-protein kinase BSK1-2-like [Dioscorea cayenensis subsp. rotundata]|uniref:Serine/threonine-protein kinase BSK1-2-like n=1 Tax=Dioscorea cayennensis subsp. rotundata TaxID=55577 RepID=A0AB40C3F2_DIOCR|nr:serine/threonine-protein kinase BSK1-2-like [Dioscorea cayenensis subsp. rotundata]
MSCFPSPPKQLENPNSGDNGHHDASGTNVDPPHHQLLQPFREYAFAELREATHGFARRYMIKKGGSELPNLTFRGRLEGGQQIVVKRISKYAWPDEEQFMEAAIKAGGLRHRRLARLIGYCCQGDARILVAEFMPNGTLAKRLFNGTKNKTMEWSLRLRVACYIAEALEYCFDEQALYFDLNLNKVLFDKVDNPCLSSFGLVKNHRNGKYYSTNIAYTPPECLMGVMNYKSMTFSFGILLRDLLSGNKISQSQAIDVLLGKKFPIVLDPRLNGEYSAEEATALVDVAEECMQYRPNDRFNIYELIVALAQVQNNAAGPSNGMPRTEGQDKIHSALINSDAR